jgi:hypothetical protein
VSDYISTHALGDYGWLERAAEVALGVGLIAFALGLREALAPRKGAQSWFAVPLTVALELLFALYPPGRGRTDTADLRCRGGDVAVRPRRQATASRSDWIRQLGARARIAALHALDDRYPGWRCATSCRRPRGAGLALRRGCHQRFMWATGRPRGPKSRRGVVPHRGLNEMMSRGRESATGIVVASQYRIRIPGETSHASQPRSPSTKRRSMRHMRQDP